LPLAKVRPQDLPRQEQRRAGRWRWQLHKHGRSAGRLTARQPVESTGCTSNASSNSFEFLSGGPTVEGHADQIRGAIQRCTRTEFGRCAGESETAEAAAPRQTARRGNEWQLWLSENIRAGSERSTVHRYKIGTWGAYHAARVAAHGLASVSRRATEKE